MDITSNCKESMLHNPTVNPEQKAPTHNKTNLDILYLSKGWHYTKTEAKLVYDNVRFPTLTIKLV